LALLWSNIHARGPATLASIERIEQLAGLDTEVGATATFLLRPADCQGDLRGLVGLVNGLLEKHVKVAGVVLTPDNADNWREVVETYRLPMSVRAIDESVANESLLRLGIRTTPTLIVQDPTGRSYSVVAIQPGVTVLSEVFIPGERSASHTPCSAGTGC